MNTFKSVMDQKVHLQVVYCEMNPPAGSCKSLNSQSGMGGLPMGPSAGPRTGASW